ncbi:MAG: hypothetical protein AB1458_13530 [Bacteroidota bacterium]
MLKKLLIPLILLLAVSAHGQKETMNDSLRKIFLAHEDSISKLMRMTVKAKDDPEKIEINTSLKKQIDEVLRLPESHSYPFDSLKKFRMMQVSDDKELRIVTWDMQMDDLSHRYFGYLQHYNAAAKSWDLFELKDKSDEIKNPETAVLSHEKWFGCYYFRIVQTEYKKKKYYTLLGWDGNDKITQKKLIEVLTFNAQGEPVFGAEKLIEVYKYIGKTDKLLIVWQNRLIFEWKQKIAMALKWDENEKLIIFDHLSPEDSSKKGQYQFYGPDFSLDALEWEKGKWRYKSDTQAGKNPGSEQDKKYNEPSKDPKVSDPPR